MEKAKDVELYRKARKIIDETYAKPSAWKSMAISRRYMALYKEKHGSDDAYHGGAKSDMAVWRRERWTDVESYLDGKPLPCGDPDLKAARKKRGKGNLPACRPIAELKRTPDAVLRDAIRRKREGERIVWKDLMEK
jgi:hypothetical protein